MFASLKEWWKKWFCIPPRNDEITTIPGLGVFLPYNPQESLFTREFIWPVKIFGREHWKWIIGTLVAIIVPLSGALIVAFLRRH